MGFKDKFKNLKECKINSTIYDAYYNQDIDDKIIYVESRNGYDFTGNIFRIVEELSTGSYGDFKIYVFAHSHVKPKIQEFKKNYNLNIYKIIDSQDKACEILHKAKYVFTDSGIRYKYVKKPGQIFVNTWHGTILKLMGIDNSYERLSMGIIQRSLLFSDYLIFPSDYLRDRLLSSFMLENVYPGKILLEGYPRNSVFLDEGKRDEFKQKFNLENHEIFIYMPTFKGLVDNRKDEKQKNDVNRFLKEIDENLKDNQILFAKLHPYNTQEIDFSKFVHIKAFPNGFEIYDIVNMADCLITDYSSVFFDFANTKRKIIIFNYDEEEYLADRGFYFPLSELPFPKVQTVKDLIIEMNALKDYDDEEFIEKFCQYERIDAVKYICETIFKGKDCCRYEIIENKKPNILLYAGDFSNDASVKSLNSFIENVDCDRYNIFISFCQWMDNIKENNEDIFDSIPQGIGFMPFSYNIMPTVKEKLKYNQLISKGNEKDYTNLLKDFFKRSFDLQYGGLEFDLIISFDAGDLNQALIFDNACDKFYLFSKDSSKVANLVGNDKIITDFDSLMDIIDDI
ncbi:CDP-glycerol glycerophosphotransferase family protein [Methanobrevibacter sp.]|uniref:CDP-glycerol glycerophosphotransferase family protein n=1 Tax=Methanobrevibacter sp. TaxID=66852 RepID=UPI00386F41BB